MKYLKMHAFKQDSDQDFEQAFTQALSKICSLTVESLLLSNSLFAQRLTNKQECNAHLLIAFKKYKELLTSPRPARRQPAATLAELASQY